MVTNFDGVNWQGIAQHSIHLFHGLFFNQPVTNIWLICHNNEFESGFFQSKRTCRGSFIKSKLSEGTWRKRPTGAEFRNHKDPVPIKKDRTFPHGMVTT